MKKLNPKHWILIGCICILCCPLGFIGHGFYQLIMLDEPFWSCVRDSQYECAEAYLKAGANPNFAFDSSVPALEVAIENEDEKMIELLKRYGAK